MPRSGRTSRSPTASKATPERAALVGAPFMLWQAFQREDVVPPATISLLLERAIASNPTNALLHVKLAHVRLDQFDFAGAAERLEAALRLDPTLPGVRTRLASCCNVLKHYERTLDLLPAAEAPDHERAIALFSLGRHSEAEREYRRILAVDPANRQACRRLSRLLRETERWGEWLEMCESLAAKGVRHTQLLYDWGIALALNGEVEKARAILFDPARLLCIALPAPEGWQGSFNARLAEDIADNPYRLSGFAEEEAANRGSSRVHSLLAGRGPALVRALLQSVQDCIGGLDFAKRGAFDPWAEARPVAARLRPWGLIQHGGAYEEWHLHRDGWLSGVYYARVPREVSAEGEGPGCIEFGPPRPLARLKPGLIETRRIAPQPGMLLLAPSHYSHRTIPTGSADDRISLAFDVEPIPAS